jgi:hypothetical protein
MWWVIMVFAGYGMLAFLVTFIAIVLLVSLWKTKAIRTKIWEEDRRRRGAIMAQIYGARDARS